MSDTLLRVVIVEDEEPQRTQIVSWLMEVPDVAIVAVVGDGAQAIEAIDRTQPNVVLLDVSIPEASGLEVLSRLTHRPDVIFTTAYRDYAIEAFELGAIDYLLKPFGRRRLLAALTRVRERRANVQDVSAPQRVASVADLSRPLEQVFVRERGGITTIRVDDIIRLESDGDYTALYAGERRHLLGLSLTVLHERINRPSFLRVHRRHVVNMAHAIRLVPHDAARIEVVLQRGSVVASKMGSQLLRRLASNDTTPP